MHPLPSPSSSGHRIWHRSRPPTTTRLTHDGGVASSKAASSMDSWSKTSSQWPARCSTPPHTSLRCRPRQIPSPTAVRSGSPRSVAPRSSSTSQAPATLLLLPRLQIDVLFIKLVPNFALMLTIWCAKACLIPRTTPSCCSNSDAFLRLRGRGGGHVRGADHPRPQDGRARLLWSAVDLLFDLLGGFDTAQAAARAYDQAAIKFRGMEADINFVLDDYREDIGKVLRWQGAGFVRGSSWFRGVTLHKCDKWEARISQLMGKKFVYLGLYDTEMDAAKRNVQKK